MPITPQARDAASRKRTREKHERWAIEMRAEGYLVVDPATKMLVRDILDATAGRGLHADAWQVAKSLAGLLGMDVPGGADRTPVDIREMARQTYADGLISVSADPDQ